MISILTHELAVRLLTVLAHTLWQALVVVLVLVLALRACGNLAHRRYIACCVALLLVAAAAIGTWVATGPAPAPRHPANLSLVAGSHGIAPTESALPSPSLESSTIAGARSPKVAQSTQASPTAPSHSPVLARIVVLLWVAGTLVMLVRLIASLGGAGRLRAGSTPLEDPAILHEIEYLRAAFGVTGRVTAALCTTIGSPAVMGIFHSTILLPVSIVAGIPATDLRALLAHELAHVRRWDYLANIIQSLIESALFFNPAVWWIGRQMRIEREAACDQMAARLLGGDSAAYARSLAKAAGPVRPALAFAMLAAAPRDPSTLRERVARLVVPGHRPALRLRWYGVLGAMLLALTILGLFGAGTFAGIALAARVLSPSERMEHLVQKQKQYGEVPERSQNGMEEYTTVTGVVLLPDGVQPATKGDVRISSRRARNSFFTSTWIEKNGRFQARVPAGHVAACAEVPGFASSFAGPVLLEDVSTTADLRIVLDPGYTAKLQVRNEAGQPVPDASLSCLAEFPVGHRGGNAHTARTDANGIALLEHMSTAPLGVKIVAEGYQPFEQDFPQLKRAEEGPVEIVLKTAKVAEGMVVDTSGAPIEGVAVKVLGRGGEGYFHNLADPDNATTAAVTDANGRFRLTDLHEGYRYTVMLDKPPHALTLVGDVLAGVRDLKLTIKPPMTIRGTVLGPMKLMCMMDPRNDRRPRIDLHYMIELGRDSRHGYSRSVAVTPQGEDRGTFYIDHLFPGQLSLQMTGRRTVSVALQLTSTLENLVIDARELFEPPVIAEGETTRDIVLRFQVPEGAPPPRGSMYVSYKGLPGDEGENVSRPIAIAGGEIHLPSRVPTKLSFHTDLTVGYWFEEKWTDVPAGTTPYVVDIPCRPAGAVYGRLLGPDGSPISSSGFVAVDMVKRPPGIGDTASSHSFVPDGNRITVRPDGRFIVTPLLFGGTYVVRASSGVNIVLSRKITITEAEPTAQVELKLPQVVSLKGRVLDDQGQPLEGVPVQITLKPKELESSFGQSTVSGTDGWFTFDGLNPQLEAAVTLRVWPMRDYVGQAVNVERIGEPLEVRLKKGARLDGVVVREDTRKPVSGAEVFATPCKIADNNKGVPAEAEQKTDDAGRFTISTLEPGVECKVHVREANVNKGFGVEAKVDGQTSVTVPITLYPGSRLAK